jgi:thymidylate synthase (FAD)
MENNIVRPKVTLLNPEAVKTAFRDIGRFASICKSTDVEAELPDKKAQIIGFSCVKAGHFSASRGIMWLFKIENMSRVASHQLVRHHVGVAINQASGVFAGATEDIVVPDSVLVHMSNHKELTDDIEKLNVLADKIYKRLTDLGTSKSDARYFMPLARVTHMNIGLTPEALMHIANERLCTKAQWEIRSIVQQMCELVKAEDPEWGYFLKPKCYRLHGCNEAVSCGLWAKYVAAMGLSNAPCADPLERQPK